MGETQPMMRSVHVDSLTSILNELAMHDRPPCSAGSPQARSLGRQVAYARWQMEELFRSTYGKRLVNQHQVILHSKVLRMLCLAGACEGLLSLAWHHRAHGGQRRG